MLYNHLSHKERNIIEHSYFVLKKSILEIANDLKRNRSTIYRELKKILEMVNIILMLQWECIWKEEIIKISSYTKSIKVSLICLMNTMIKDLMELKQQSIKLKLILQ